MSLWFTEEDQLQNVRMSYEIVDVLFSGKSEFQTVEVLKTKGFGNLLVLDGCVMLTDLDEFVYHEMIAHIPMGFAEKPKNVVIVGGGDGGTAREVLKHPCVEKVTLCEIDGMVIEKSKEFFPEVAKAFGDPRLDVVVGDGIDYVKKLRGVADLLIIDSTDPIGPGEGLFSKAFYADAAKALTPDGLMVAQTESIWFPKEVLQKICQNISAGFSHIKPYIGVVPTYPRGHWSWTMAKNGEFPAFSPDFLDSIDGLRYLTPGVARGALELPPFYREKIQK